MAIKVGDRTRSRPYAVTRDAVIAFARDFDPQPFHLDDAAAAAHPLFGRLAASGWHTCAMAMRLTVEAFDAAHGPPPLGGAGIDEIRWLRPVYPGDTLLADFTVLGLTRAKPRAGMVLVRIETLVSNQDGQPVMRHVSNVIYPEEAVAAGD